MSGVWAEQPVPVARTIVVVVVAVVDADAAARREQLADAMRHHLAVLAKQSVALASVIAAGSIRMKCVCHLRAACLCLCLCLAVVLMMLLLLLRGP